MSKCCVCGKVIDPKKDNGIYGYYGLKYYCKKLDCQKRFIEDAGDPPLENLIDGDEDGEGEDDTRKYVGNVRWKAD